ncbi:MAG: hypothetical protein ACK4WC_03110 [Rubrimonas sp.]
MSDTPASKTIYRVGQPGADRAKGAARGGAPLHAVRSPSGAKVVTADAATHRAALEAAAAASRDFDPLRKK